MSCFVPGIIEDVRKVNHYSLGLLVISGADHVGQVAGKGLDLVHERIADTRIVRVHVVGKVPRVDGRVVHSRLALSLQGF